MKQVLAIAGVNLQRLLRDRANIFFVGLFPMLIIVVLGLSFGGSFEARIGVTAFGESGPLAEDLIVSLDETEDVTVERFDDEETLLVSVERGRLNAGLVVPVGYDNAVTAGETVRLRYYSRPDQLGQEVRPSVEAALAGQAARVTAARFVELEGLASFSEGLRVAETLDAAVSGPKVEVNRVGEAVLPESLDTFDLGASQQLLLFIFLTSLTSSVALIETRQLGISRRMLATPTSAAQVIAGEALGRLTIALTQGLVIMAGSLLLFQVNWGNPLGAAAVLLTFSLVGSGAGMLTGSVLTNTQQAGALGLLIGLGFGALGGSMVPLEVFPDTMRQLAHATPHAWALDAFAELVRRGGTIADIVFELLALLAIATVLFALAAWRFWRAIVA